MTFTPGVDRIMDQNLVFFARVLGDYMRREDYDGLIQLRLDLVEEYVADAERFEDADYRIGRIRGEQWKLERKIEMEPEVGEKMSILLVDFWLGSQFLLDKNRSVS